MNYNGTGISWRQGNVRSSDTTIGEVLYQPGGTCGPRFERDYELVLLHSGSGTVDLDNKSIQLQTDVIYLFCPGQRQRFKFTTHEETHHAWCAISPQALSSNLFIQIERAKPVAPCTRTFHALLQAALALEAPNGVTGEHVVNAIGLALFAEFIRNSGLLDTPHHHISVARAVTFMEDNYMKEDCLQQTSHATGVSRNTLTAHFRLDLHTTPGEYLWTLRLQKALAMLAGTGLTCAEIAYCCGFKNPYHFSRKFKQVHGTSPSTYRNSAWQSS